MDQDDVALVRAHPLAIAPRGWVARTRPAGRTGYLAFSAFCGMLALVWASNTAGIPVAVAGFLTLLVTAFAAVVGWVRLPGAARPVALVNAVTLTRADIAVPDSWVHFAPGRGRRLPGVLALVLPALGLLSLAVVVASTGHAFIDFGPFVLFLASGIGGLIGVVLSVREIARWYRQTSFGRRPVGVAFGRTGVLLVGLGDPLFVAWDDVTDVLPTAAAADDPRAVTPFVRIDAPRVTRLDATPTLEAGPVFLALDALDADPVAVWSIVRAGAKRSSFRDLLGTGRAQVVIDEWVRRASTPGLR